MMYRGELEFQAKSKTNAILNCNINRFLEYPGELTLEDAVCEDNKGKTIKELFNTLNQIY